MARAKMAKTSDKGFQQTHVFYDRWLLSAALLLLTMGLLMVASASMEVALKNYHNRFFFFLV